MVRRCIERFCYDRFVRGYDWLLAPLERAAFAEHRARLLAGADGRVLDVGAGTGVNFGYFGRGLSVTAIDFEPLMLAQARARASTSAADIALAVASAEELPFADRAFDTVVITLALCTIPSVRRTLSEIRRVLRPAGHLLLLEHVRSTSRALALAQDAVAPLHRVLAAGCNLNRDTVGAVVAAGFTIRSQRDRFAGSLVELEATC